MRIIAAVFVGVVFLCVATTAQEFKGPPWTSATRCTTQDAIAADSDLDRLTNWTAVHRTFRLYRQCDDGGIAEGYSDKVVILLTEHWSTVTELVRLVQNDDLFGNFVLLHVDGLMSPEQSKTIIDNATNKCPAGAKQFCRRLEARARAPL